LQTNRFLSLTVLIILVLNIILLMRMGDLENRMQNISHNYSNLQSSLNSISSNVNSNLDRFTREQSWITPVQVNHDKTKVDNEQGIAVLNWQIKDFQQGAEVVFHYRESQAEEFIAIPAESKGAGFFEVELPVEINVEPYWEIGVHKTEGRATAEQAVREIKEINKAAEQPIEHYVSMKAKDITKSGEVSYLHLDYLSHTKYEPIQGHVNINNSKYNFSIYERYPSPSGNNFDSIKVKFYDGDNLIADKPIEVQDVQNDSKTYFLDYDAGSQNISRLVIQVQYINGKIFEKEIY